MHIQITVYVSYSLYKCIYITMQHSIFIQHMYSYIYIQSYYIPPWEFISFRISLAESFLLSCSRSILAFFSWGRPRIPKLIKSTGSWPLPWLDFVTSLSRLVPRSLFYSRAISVKVHPLSIECTFFVHLRLPSPLPWQFTPRIYSSGFPWLWALVFPGMSPRSSAASMADYLKPTIFNGGKTAWTGFCELSGGVDLWTGTLNHIEHFHRSTSIVPQEALQLTTPSVFSSAINLEPRFRCPRCSSARATGTPVAPTANSKRNALLSVLFWPFRELLRSPFRKTFPLTARFWPSGDFLSQTTLARSFLRETTVPSFLGRLQHGLKSRRPSSQPSHFLQRFILVRSLQSSPNIVCYWSVLFSVSV